MATSGACEQATVTANGLLDHRRRRCRGPRCRWQFRTHDANADRLLNAFDFGHAILYETLWRFPNAPASELETKRHEQLTTHAPVHPPRVSLEETSMAPRDACLAPEARVTCDWAHLLHRQLYVGLADELPHLMPMTVAVAERSRPAAGSRRSASTTCTRCTMSSPIS
jgi:hypothetical protein